MDSLERLLGIMARLRDPDTGCAWDLKQSFASLIPYTLEEAYEVVDAIERGNCDDLREELGDLLLQIVFHSQLAREQALFDFSAVAESIADKLVRRHPHVFGDLQFADDAERARHWEMLKQQERMAKSDSGSASLPSVFDGIPRSLPALMHAQKLQNRAARTGFDWPELGALLDKLNEEWQELREAHAEGDIAHVREELGDLLFMLVNLARHLRVDAEVSLRSTNRKFENRFRFIEECLAVRGQTPGDCTLAELDSLWDEAKRQGL